MALSTLVLPNVPQHSHRVVPTSLPGVGRPAGVCSVVQVQLYSSIPLAQSRTMSIRDLESSRVSKLVLLTGIITAASKPRVRP